MSSQSVDSRAASGTSSPPRSFNSTSMSVSTFASRLPVPRRCLLSLANKENEQLLVASSTATTITATSKPLSTLPARNVRQPLSVLPASESNITAAHRTTATAAASTSAADATADLSPEPLRSSPRTRRQWVKSMDVLPVIMPNVVQCSPSSAVSDSSTSSDDTVHTPDRSDTRPLHFEATQVDTPVDVRASTIAALQACISDMQAQHTATISHNDASIQAVTEELQQCRTQLGEARVDAARAQQQLAESEAKWTVAQSRWMESKQRDSEIKELRRQLASIRMELSTARPAQPSMVGERSEGHSGAEAMRLPVLVGDCIKRQRKTTLVG